MAFYRRNRKEYQFILLFTFIKLFLHLSANSNFGFHRDELLYFALGEHLDWGYKEVPPFIAFISWISMYFFGDSVFAARILSTLFGTMIVYLTGLTVLTLGGKRLAIAIACLGVIISPAFLASGYLLQPVVFDQFFWVLTAYCLIRFIKTSENRYLYMLGVAAGLGMTNKYTMALYLAALFGALLLTPQRRIFINKAWLAAAAIALLIFLPNLVWQINHQFPVIRHMNELRETQLDYIEPLDFFLQQLLVHATSSLIWISGFIYLFFSAALKRFRFAGITYVLVVLLLMILQGKPYYSFGAYPVLFAVGGIALSRVLSRLPRSLQVGTLAAILLPSMLFIPVAIPVLPFRKTLQFFEFTTRKLKLEFPVKWEDQQLHATTQDYADMLGWEELAAGAATSFNRIPESERQYTTIFANNYGQAGAIDRFRRKYNLPPTVCLNSSYALWSPQRIKTRHVIYINDEYPDDLKPAYKRIIQISEITNPYAREKGTKVYLLSYPVKDISPIYSKHRREQLE